MEGRPHSAPVRGDTGQNWNRGWRPARSPTTFQVVLGDQATEAVGQALGQRRHVVVGGLGNTCSRLARMQCMARALADRVAPMRCGRGPGCPLACLREASMLRPSRRCSRRCRRARRRRSVCRPRRSPGRGSTVSCSHRYWWRWRVSVDDQQAAVFCGQLAALLHEAGTGQTMPMLVMAARTAGRRRRPGPARLPALRTSLNGMARYCIFGQVIGLDRPGRSGARSAVAAAHHHVVDGAVVAAVEHQQGLAPGHGAGPAQHVAVGVGGGGGDLPERQAEARGQQLAADHGVPPGSMVVRLLLVCSAMAWRSGPASGRTWCRCRPGRSRCTVAVG